MGSGLFPLKMGTSVRVSDKSISDAKEMGDGRAWAGGGTARQACRRDRRHLTGQGVPGAVQVEGLGAVPGAKGHCGLCLVVPLGFRWDNRDSDCDVEGRRELQGRGMSPAVGEGTVPLVLGVGRHGGRQ